jgi:hypothetical protein
LCAKLFLLIVYTRSPRSDPHLPRGVRAESAAEDVPHEELFARQADFLEHCFIAKSVLIGSSDLHGRAEMIHEFLPRGDDLSVRV